MRPRFRSRSILIALTCVAGVAASGSVAPARAGDVSFALGASFAVGGAFFQVAYASPQPGYLPYYYRTAAPLRYSGYECGPYCFKSGAHWYHGPACGLVLHHFTVYGFAGPGYYVEGYSPYPPAPYPYAYGPAPGHYLPFYGRGSSGHRHRSHGYSTYGYHYPYGGAYGYFSYQGGHRYQGREHGHSYGKSHRDKGRRGKSYEGRGHRGGHHRPGEARRTRPRHD